MAITGLSLLAVAVGVLWATGSGGGSSAALDATPTSRPTETSTPGPTSTPEDPLGAVPLTIGDPIPFPEHTSMVVMQVPYSKSWGVTSLERWTRGTGAVVRETVFDSGENHISGVASDGQAIYVGLVTGECPYCLPSSDPGRFTTIYASNDGGMTWESSEPVEGVWIPAAVDAAGLVARNLSSSIVDYARPADGDLEPIVIPQNVDLELGPVVVDGVLAWQSRGSAALIDSGGTVLKPDFYDPLAFRTASLIRTPSSTFLTWTNESTSPAEPAHYVIEADSASGRAVFPKRVLRTDELPVIVDALDNQVLVGLQWFEPDAPAGHNEGITPTLIDFDTATAYPIAEFREHYIAIIPILAYEGPFLRVNTPGDCLNIRTTVGTNAPVLECAADGVLLGDREDTWERDGVTWLAVRTPAGDIGWASAEFLAR
jgi:hypothetical protein